MSNPKTGEQAANNIPDGHVQIMTFPEQSVTQDTEGRLYLHEAETEDTATIGSPDAESLQTDTKDIDVKCKLPKRKRLARLAIGATFPIAVGIGAIHILPGQEVEINGITMSAKPALQNYSHVGLGLAGDYKNPAHKTMQGVDLGAEATVDNAQGLNLQNSLIQAGAVQILKHPGAASQRVSEAAEQDVLIKGGISAGAALLLELAVLGYAARDRKNFGGDNSANLSEAQAKDISSRRRTRRTVTASSLILSYGYAGMVLSSPQRADVPAGGELTGALSNVLSVLNPGSDDRFVKKVQHNTDALLAAHPELVPKGSEWTKIAVIDDPENVASMTSETGKIAQDTDADAVIVNGDAATFEDTGVGMLDMDALAETAKKKPKVLIDGDHDTPKGNRYAESDDFTVSDGNTHTISGVRVLEIPSVYVTTINSGESGSTLRNPDIDEDTSIANMVTELQKNKAQIVFAHDHKYLEKLAAAFIKATCPKVKPGQTADATCQIPFFFGGRTFDEPGVTAVTVPGYEGPATVYTAGSGGGHRDTSLQFELKNPSNQNVLFYNKKTGAIQMLVFTINVDGSIKAKLRILKQASVQQALASRADENLPTVTPSQVAPK